MTTTKTTIKKIPGEKELNVLRDECYKIARKHGWHDVERSERHFLCLVITELSEAVEADRKNLHANLEAFNSANGTKHVTWDRSFEGWIKDTVEDELADAAIRILDLTGVLAVNIGIRVWNAANQHQETLIGYYRKNYSFTEFIYRIVSLLTYPVRYGEALFMLFVLADVVGFDLMDHIHLKMEYNKTRERLHGKRY